MHTADKISLEVLFSLLTISHYAIAAPTMLEVVDRLSPEFMLGILENDEEKLEGSDDGNWLPKPPAKPPWCPSPGAPCMWPPDGMKDPPNDDPLVM